MSSHDELGKHGGHWGSPLLWGYTAIVQIVLVNLLIAMMTDTYNKVQKNATDEWRFQRVSIVDEFASIPNIPSTPPPTTTSPTSTSASHGHTARSAFWWLLNFASSL